MQTRLYALTVQSGLRCRCISKVVELRQQDLLLKISRASRTVVRTRASQVRPYSTLNSNPLDWNKVLNRWQPLTSSSMAKLSTMQRNESTTDPKAITPKTRKQTVLIIGSSIAGTVFALQLLTHPILRAKYRPIVFDSAKSLPHLAPSAETDSAHPEGQSGAAVALTKQAMWPLQQLNLGRELYEVSQNTERLAMFRQPFFGPQDGSQFGTQIINWNASSEVGIMGGLWTVERGKLQGLLIKNILERGGEIILNRKLTEIIEHSRSDGEGAVEAVFDNSDSCRGDLLAGADGAWSSVRKHIFTCSSPSGEQIIDEGWKPYFQDLHIMHGICHAQTTDTKPTIYGMGLYGVGTGTWTLTNNRQMWTIYEAPCGPPPTDAEARMRSDEASRSLSKKWNMNVFTGGYDQASTEAFLKRYRNVWHPSAGTFGKLFDSSETIVRVGLWQRLFTRLGNVKWEPGDDRPKECGKDVGGSSKTGNIVLIGDAARVLMPTAGQGMWYGVAGDCSNTDADAIPSRSLLNSFHILSN